MFRILPVCLFSLLLMLSATKTHAATTITSSSGNNVQTDESAAMEAIQQNYGGLSPSDFGFPSSGENTGPDGQPLSEEELEAIRNMREGEETNVQQQENDPTNQVYKGAADDQKPYDPPRTHLMYDDTRY